MEYVSTSNQVIGVVSVPNAAVLLSASANFIYFDVIEPTELQSVLTKGSYKVPNTAFRENFNFDSIFTRVVVAFNNVSNGTIQVLSTNVADLLNNNLYGFFAEFNAPQKVLHVQQSAQATTIVAYTDAGNASFLSIFTISSSG